MSENEVEIKNIYTLKWDIGAHTAFEKRICDTLWTSINYGMYVTQFFMGSPQGYNRAKISQEDILECKKILAKYPMHVFTHFPYLGSLSGSKDILAWNGDSEQDAKTSHIVESLEYELGIIGNFSSTETKSGVVIHPGFATNRQQGLLAVAKSINKIRFKKGMKLILENSAGQGTSLATTFEELKTIIDNVDDDKKEFVGVCIDTCHIYAYGTYDLSRIDEMERMFTDFDELIGLHKLSLIHLNDSEKLPKSRVDRHACLGTGYIWKNGFESLIYLLDRCKGLKVPLLLETHGIDMVTLACLQK